MCKALRTTLSLVVSLALLSAVTMAKAGGNVADKGKDREHHSRFAKIAFWRHHKNVGKNTKVQPTKSKPAEAKQAAVKNDRKQPHDANNVSKPTAKKSPAVDKTKPRHKVQEPKTASLEQ